MLVEMRARSQIVKIIKEHEKNPSAVFESSINMDIRILWMLLLRHLNLL